MSRVNSVEILESIRPPQGFHLHSLIACTYTFDPDLGLALLAHAADDSLESQDILEDIPGNRERVRQVLIENLPKAIFLCDGHGPLMGKSEFSGTRCLFLDHVVKRTRFSKGTGSFHPKLVLALYLDDNDNCRGRLYIGSKNLSRNTMQEFGVVLNLNSSKKSSEFNTELLAFLNDLNVNELASSSYGKKLVLKNAISTLNKYQLTVPDSSIKMYWQSRWGKGASLHKRLDHLFLKKWRDVQVHSLWAREVAINWISHGLAHRLVEIRRKSGGCAQATSSLESSLSI